MNYLILLIICILAFVNCDGQLNIDSLSKVLTQTESDTITLNNYNQKIKTLENDDIEAMELIGNWIAKSANNKGYKKIEATAYIHMVMKFNDANIYDKAVLYATKADEIAEKNNFPEIKTQALNELGNMYMHNHQYTKATEYYTQSIVTGETHNYKSGVAVAKYNFAGMIMQQHYTKKDSVKKALIMMLQSLVIVKELKDTSSIINMTEGTSQAYLDLQQFDSSINLLKQTEQIILSTRKKEALSSFYMRFGDAYFQKGDNDKALSYLKMAVPIAIDCKQPRMLYNIYSLMAECYENKKNFAEANKYNKLYSVVYDSLLNAENFTKAADMQNRYQREKKEKELIKLSLDNRYKSTLSKIFIGSTIGLGLLGFLGYRNFRAKRKLQQAKITELEKDKHLLAIDAMLKGQEEERSRIAKDLHDGLGGMLSGTKLSFMNMKENLIMDAPNVSAFENSILQLDNTITELRKVAHNLMPEALVKFGLKNAILDYCNALQLSSKTKIVYEQMGEDRALGNTTDLYIYRIIQELVNNSIKHASANTILVQLTKTPQKVLITVEDDGKGFDKNLLNTAKGIGLQSVQQRIDYLKGSLQIDTQPNEGTSFHIELQA
jgi:two-component system, NarL family, sensor kinase